MYNAKIICDSISETGKRLTTMEVTFPRIVLAEFNTHRMFSRNSASSRAIPFKKQIQRIVDNPFIPEKFPVDGKGMQPNAYITKDDKRYNILLNYWLEARNAAIESASNLYSGLEANLWGWDYRKDEKPDIAIHKQICNRLLEPFMWHTVIVTATEWDNFFKLRTHKDAQYEIRRVADLMYDAYHKYLNTSGETSNSIPQRMNLGDWHLPYIAPDEHDLCLLYKDDKKTLDLHIDNLKKISVARCARVSYLTHDGKRDIEKDLELFERLRTSGHWSPFEHVATPHFFIRHAGTYENLRSGNFIGWKQYRKEFQDENCTHFRLEQ